MRIALLDTDPAEQSMVLALLDRSGFDARAYVDAPAFLADSKRRRFDALIVDWSAGTRTTGALLGTPMPTLLMIANPLEDDIVAGLSAGADDYLLKPIRPSELLARLQALLRRAYPDETFERFDFDPYRFDPLPCEVVVAGTPVVLTQKEFDLALLLFRNAGRPLSRNHIRESVWGSDADISSRTLDTHVSRLRSKLGLGTQPGYRVMPVYGYGYRLDRLEAPDAAPEEDDARPL